MKTKTTARRSRLAAWAAVPLITGITITAPAQVTDMGEQGWNRLGISGRLLFNVGAEFQHRASPADPGPGLGIHGVNRIYDNGYVRLDDSNNAGGRTWNWGFNDQSSISGNTLLLETVRSPADGLIERRTDDPHYGFEISYGRVLKAFPIGRDRERRLLAGVHGAFGHTWFDIRHASSFTGATSGVRDSYDLSGLPLIPNAPFFGSAPEPGGPLPLLLPDAPFNREDINVPATATQRLQVDGRLYGFKLGPFVELPVHRAVSLQLQGGFAALLVDGRFTYSEQLSTGGASAGRASSSQWRYGGFVEGQVSLALEGGWSLFAGAGWQHLGSHSIAGDTKAVRLKLDHVGTGFAGVRWAF